MILGNNTELLVNYLYVTRSSLGLLGGWVSYQIFKKGAWQDLNSLQEVAGKEGVTILSRGREGL